MQEKYEKMRLLNAYICETNAVYHELAQALDLSDSVMQVLYTALTGGGSCTVREVCFLTGISKQTLNSALRKMESDGLLRLEAVDGKQKRICLTEAGLALANKTALVELDMETAILDSWPEEDREAYLRLMKRYLDDLRRGVKALQTRRKDKL